VHKIWRKNFKGLLSYHILGVGSFFSRTLYMLNILRKKRKQTNNFLVSNQASNKSFRSVQ